MSKFRHANDDGIFFDNTCSILKKRSDANRVSKNPPKTYVSSLVAGGLATQPTVAGWLVGVCWLATAQQPSATKV